MPLSDEYVNRKNSLLEQGWGWEFKSDLDDITATPDGRYTVLYRPSERNTDKYLTRNNAQIRLNLSSSNTQAADNIISHLIYVGESNSPENVSMLEGAVQMNTVAPEEEYEKLIEQVTNAGWRFIETVRGITHPQHFDKPVYRHLLLGTSRWQGQKGMPVTFPLILHLTDDPVVALQSLWDKMEFAKQEFVDRIPYQNIYGEIKEDLFKTRLLREYLNR